MINRKGTVQYLSVLMIGGAMLVSGTVLTRLSHAQGEPSNVQTLEGIVSDGMCGASHGGKDAVECTQMCVRAGKGWAFVVGDTVYELGGRMRGVDVFAGQKASITGRIMGNKIVVSSVDRPTS